MFILTPSFPSSSFDFLTSSLTFALPFVSDCSRSVTLATALLKTCTLHASVSLCILPLLCVLQPKSSLLPSGLSKHRCGRIQIFIHFHLPSLSIRYFFPCLLKLSCTHLHMRLCVTSVTSSSFLSHWAPELTKPVLRVKIFCSSVPPR